MLEVARPKRSMRGSSSLCSSYSSK